MRIIGVDGGIGNAFAGPVEIDVMDDEIGSTLAGSMEVSMVDDGIGGALASSVEIAMVDPKGTKPASDGAKITAENVIGVAMEDPSEKEREEVEHELQCKLEEEMME
jgi:hypothetical protein